MRRCKVDPAPTDEWRERDSELTKDRQVPGGRIRHDRNLVAGSVNPCSKVDFDQVGLTAQV